MLRKYPKLFIDPVINYPIHDLDLPFSDYIQQSKKIIAMTRQDLAQHAEHIIHANAPFELHPEIPKPKSGVLLIHGLLDSPFIMRDIGESLRSQGLLVRSIMLPGHATVPGALLNTRYSDWLQAVNYGIATLKQDVENIFIVGFSTGGNLALHHAAKNPDIAGLILLAPAFKINSPFAFISKSMSHTTWPDRAKWFYLTDEIDYVKYQSVCFNAIWQVYQLGIEIQKMQTTSPMLLILSHEDTIICSRTAINYFKQTKNPRNQAIIYSAKALNNSDKRIHIKNAVYPDKNILDFCHISLPVSPNNPHYGTNGDCPYASRPNKNIKYCALDKLDMAFQHMLRKWHISHFDYQRLTYNPDFEEMQKEIGNFINHVVKHCHASGFLAGTQSLY